MLLHVALLREGFVAEVAGKGLEAAVDPEVSVEVGPLRESLAAQLAAVAELLVVGPVHLHVRLEVAGRLEELSAEAALELLLVRVHEVVARVEVAPRVDLPAYLARLRRPPLGVLPLLRLVLVDHLVALDVGDRLRGEAALLVPALVEHLPDQIQLSHCSISNSLPCFIPTTYLIIRMLLLPMNQIVLVGLGLLVAEGAGLQGDQRLLAPSGSRAGHLALLDLPDDEAIFQEVFLYPRRGSAANFWMI